MNPIPSPRSDAEPRSAIAQRPLPLAAPLLGLTLFALAAWVLRREFQTYHLDDVWAHLAQISSGTLALAVAITVVGYLELTLYDTLAFRHLGNPLAYPRIALSSFVAYVFAHNIGLSFFGSTAVRYRMLSAWGIANEDIARVVAFTMLTFWMGFFLLGGVLHSLWPLPLGLEGLPLADSRPIGFAFLGDLWWRFDAADAAPRSLRAMSIAAVALLGVGGLRLFRPVPPIPDLPSPTEIDRAHAIAARAPRTSAYLALLGDKELLFSADGRGFLMYGIAGRSWVAMGDPVGPPEVQEELAWRFAELADQHGARPVFYEVSGEALGIYLELGMDLRKLGEEGRVPLREFTLEGSARKGLRSTLNRMAREGGHFEIVPAAGVPALLDELERISEVWLADKHTREKRFSLGFFDRAYLCRLPVAVVRVDGKIVAFANVWPSEARIELSTDLMRYDGRAPPGVMEFLFSELMLWGRREGYQYFSLGMAPLSGFEQHRLAPLWNRLGALLFRNGEHFYDFQGLRQFKDKFDPEWDPRYLAAQGGWFAAPVVLTRIASLVSGGVAGVVSK